MITDLHEWAGKNGYKIAWGGASVVMDVREDFDSLRAAGEIDGAFYEDNLAWFEYPEGITLQSPASVIIVAVPRPAHSLPFEHQNGRLDTILPPTYVNYNKLFEQVHDDMDSSVLRGTCCSELLKAPLKAIAARLGLVAYGRNNITYIEGLGSYFQLVGVLTDAELPPPSGSISNHPRMNPQCSDCSLCIQACPTKAIRSKRFLLGAQRCFTLHNESPQTWPEWILPLLDLCFSAQPCVIGCLRCQAVCPMNRGLLKTEPAGISFTAGETQWLLEGKPCDSNPLGAGIMSKLSKIGMGKDYSPLAKNLRELSKQS